MALGLSACYSIKGLARSQASQEFSCPEAQIEAVEVSDRWVRATGCGKDALYLSFYSGAVQSPPRTRASFDLSCPAGELKMVALGGNSIGMEGCGKKASYTWVDHDWVGH